MSALKFACPHCDQHIEAEDHYAGVQIQCPRCLKEMVVPGTPQPTVLQPPTAPVPGQTGAGAPLRVSLKTTRPSAEAPPPTPEPAPAAPRPVTMPFPARREPEVEGENRGGKVGKVALVVALVLIAPVAIYYVFAWAGSAQKKFNEARAKDEDPGVIGGQLSHIAELNRVLEMTDRMTGTQPDTPQARKAAADAAAAAAAAKVITPAKWTLDVEKAQIPAGVVAGLVAGSNFVARNVVLYTGGAVPILALRSGEGPSVDHELLVYLRLKPGEKLEGRSWSISKDQPPAGTQVAKRWSISPRLPPQQKAFVGGYAMKLEFGQPDDGELPGKVYLALPDPEQTVAGGVFSAEIRVLNPANQTPERSSRGSTFDE